ncbi:MAG TPA: hypothetical protein VF981_16600 [Gemmatimonadaceae bacterium]
MTPTEDTHTPGLEKYVQHLEGCDSLSPRLKYLPKGHACTCGLMDALAESEAARQAAEAQACALREAATEVTRVMEVVMNRLDFVVPFSTTRALKSFRARFQRLRQLAREVDDTPSCPHEARVAVLRTALSNAMERHHALDAGHDDDVGWQRCRNDLCSAAAQVWGDGYVAVRALTAEGEAG